MYVPSVLYVQFPLAMFSTLTVLIVFQNKWFHSTMLLNVVIVLAVQVTAAVAFRCFALSPM